MDISFDAGLTGVPVGGDGCAAPAGARTTPANTSFGSALAGALGGAALKDTPTPRGGGLPEDGATAGSWTNRDVLAGARAAAAGGRRGVAGSASTTATAATGQAPDPQASSQIGAAAAMTDIPQGTATASVAADEPIPAQDHLKDGQTPLAAAVLVDAPPAEVLPCANTTAHHLSGEAQDFDGENASGPQGQPAGAAGAGGTGISGLTSGLPLDLLHPMPAQVTLSPEMVAGAQSPPGAAPPGLPDVASIAAAQGMARADVSGLAGTAQESAPESGVSSPATFARAAAERLGSSLGDVPPGGTSSLLPSAVSDGVTQAGGGSAETLAASIRSSFTRFFNSGVRQSSVEPATVANEPRLASGPLTFVADPGNAAVDAQGADQTARSAAVAEAGKTPVQLADQVPIASPIRAENELAKAALWSEDITEAAAPVRAAYGVAPPGLPDAATLARAAAERLGSSLGDVPPSGTFPVLPFGVSDSVTQAGGGSAETLAASIRSSFTRFFNSDVRQSTARLVTVANEPHLVSGQLAFAADPVNATGPGQGADQTARSAAVAEAGKTPYQLAQQVPIESPIWARNELAKAVKWSEAIVQQVQLAAAGAGSDGGDTSLGSSTDRQPSRDGSSPPAQPFGSALGLGASNGLGGSLAATPSSPAAVRSGEPIPEPTTESGSLTHSIVRVMKLQWSQGGGEVQLQLRPEHLGELTVALKVESGAVSATLRSDSPIVRAWIERHQEDLRTGLRESGLTLERLSIDPDGRPRDNRDRERDVYQPEPGVYPRRRLPGTQFDSLI